MTEVIELQQATTDHRGKQPADARYALYCTVIRDPYEVVCDSIKRMGHLGNFRQYAEGRQVGIEHPHDVILRFYPNSEFPSPSDDFLSDFRQQSNT